MRRIIRLFEDHLLTIGLVALTIVMASALHVNYDQTTKIDALVKSSQQEEDRVKYLDCLSRRDGRDSLRQLIHLIATSPNITADRSEAYLKLLDDLPEVQCPTLATAAPNPNKESITVSTWSPEKIAAIIGAIIPILTALSTHFAAAAKVKAGIAFVLAFIAGPVVTFIQTNQSIISWASARSGLVAWGVALLTYLGAWKPIVALNSKALPNKGLGAPKA